MSIELQRVFEENMPFSFDDYGKLLAANSLIMQLGEQNQDLTWNVPNKVSRTSRGAWNIMKLQNCEPNRWYKATDADTIFYLEKISMDDDGFCFGCSVRYPNEFKSDVISGSTEVIQINKPNKQEVNMARSKKQTKKSLPVDKNGKIVHTKESAIVKPTDDPKLPKEGTTSRAIYDLWKEGLTGTEIRAKLDVSRNTLYSVLHSFKVKFGEPELKPATKPAPKAKPKSKKKK
jgi:hypothetical protein